MTTLRVKFDDFKELSKGKHIDFIKLNNEYEFMFNVDKVLVKTIVLISEMKNEQEFLNSIKGD